MIQFVVLMALCTFHRVMPAVSKNLAWIIQRCIWIVNVLQHQIDPKIAVLMRLIQCARVAVIIYGILLGCASVWCFSHFWLRCPLCPHHLGRDLIMEMWHFGDFNGNRYFFCWSLFRCVHTEQRSFALGIQWIIVRILGTIPGKLTNILNIIIHNTDFVHIFSLSAPMIFGTLIDDSCVLWQESCKETGACLVYDNSSLSR